MIRLFEPGFFDDLAPSVERSLADEQVSAFERLSLSNGQSFAEAVTWCSAEPLLAEPVATPSFQRSHSLQKEASAIYMEAYGQGETYATGRNYKRAKELSAQVDFAALIPLRGQLRTPALDPGKVSDFIHENRFQDAVTKVLELRLKKLEQREFKTISTPSQDKGWLLFYFPYENVSDGASECSSYGFFDGNDAPPWDTWISFEQGRLISWVPNILIPAVQHGIDVNCVDCIRWAN